MKIIINCNLEIPAPTAKTYKEAIIEAENYELPKEYVSDSFEIVKVLDEKDNEIIE